MTMEFTNIHGNWDWEQAKLIQPAAPAIIPNNNMSGQIGHNIQHHTQRLNLNADNIG